MLYFKHSEVAKKYHVSLRTVHNWLDAAKAGKLDLDLHKQQDKLYVANTSRNLSLLSHLSEDRRKYRNTKAAKTITPKPEFYTLFSDNQVFDIINNLEIHHEIPRQYNYFDGGADNWARYIERLADDTGSNTLTSTIRLLDINKAYLDTLLADYSRINVVDIGVGNAYPVRGLLSHLQSQKKLGRYIALDISPSMLKIAEENINSWFKDSIPFEGYECDINYERFSKLLTGEQLNQSENVINLVLLFGGTPSNVRYPENGFKMIHDSMGLNDLLIYSARLDTETSRHYFDFNFEPVNTTLSPNHRLIFDLLNVAEQFYEVEIGYDPTIRQRFIRVRLKVAITIKFSFKGGERQVELNKDDTILLWRGIQHDMTSVLHQFDRSDFRPFHMSQTPDYEYMLTISRVKHD